MCVCVKVTGSHSTAAKTVFLSEKLQLHYSATSRSPPTLPAKARLKEAFLHSVEQNEIVK